MKHVANSNSKSCYFNGKFSQFLVYIALFPSFTSSGLAVSKYLKTIIKTTEDNDTLLATKTIPRSLLWIQFPRQSVVTSCLNWYTTWRHVKNLNNQNSTHSSCLSSNHEMTMVKTLVVSDFTVVTFVFYTVYSPTASNIYIYTGGWWWEDFRAAQEVVR